MKILMATMSLGYGGAETHIVELSKELKREGHSVVVCSNGGVYTNELEKAGIKHYTVPLHNKSPKNMIRSKKLLRKIILKEKVDVVHAHARIPGYICGLLHKSMKFPYVTTAHWVFSLSYFYRKFTNWGEKTIAVSDDIKKYLIENYSVPEKNIYVTINGIDTNKFSPDTDYSDVLSEFNIDKNSKKIVYISRMDESRAKVAFELADIALRLNKEIENLQIVIVGGGDVFDKLEKKCEEINKQAGRNLIVLTNSRSDINKFAAMSDIFIGVSRSALEAMAAEKCVIIAGNEGYIGIYDQNKLEVGINTNFCCRGCEMSSPELLYNDIIKLNSMPEEDKKNIRKFSKETILKYYSVEKMAGNCIDAYNSAINEDKREKYDIIISGYYGYHNAGDDAILNTMINNLIKRKKDLKILVLTKNTKKTKESDNIYTLNRFNIFKLNKILKNTKLLLSGGGSLIQDETSSHSLLYYLFIIKLALKNNCKTMLYSNGIGPINKFKNQKKVKNVLNNTNLITLRDLHSKKFLSDLGVNRPEIICTADEAITIVPCSKEDTVNYLKNINFDPDNNNYLCISLRKWKKSDPDFINKMAEIINSICDTNNMIPLFLPFKNNEDNKIHKHIIKLCKKTPIIIDKNLSESYNLGVIKLCKAIISVRLHPIIFGICSNIPTYGIMYDPKIKNFLDYIDNKNYCNIKNMNSKNIINDFNRVIKEYESNSMIYQEKIEKLKELSKENSRLAIELLSD